MWKRFWRMWTVDKPASPWGQERGRSIPVRVGSLFRATTSHCAPSGLVM